MSHSLQPLGDVSTAKYIITHVFFPLKPPDRKDLSVGDDHSLARAIAAGAHLYGNRTDQGNLAEWNSISRTLENLRDTVASPKMGTSRMISQLNSMAVGDVLALHIRAQNAGIIFRKQEAVTIFESFELSPKAQDVNATRRKLICSYPGPAIEIPNLVFDDEGFRHELVNFLAHMNHDDLDDVGTGSKNPPFVFKNTVHPCYITELLTGILRSVGSPADVARISKRVGDEFVWKDDSTLPWRRSPLWLLTKVALQTTLDRSPLGHHAYKEFILFFMCYLAEEKICTELSSDLLQFMLIKISRRVQKLGSSVPDWLSHTVLRACTSLRSTIETRWKLVETVHRLSPPWTPWRLDLIGDTQLSLSHSSGYILNALADNNISPRDVSFNPTHRYRGALPDFLSSDGGFFEEAYNDEPRVALYDVERAVELGIDAWVGRVTNRDEACVQLGTLAYKYSSNALRTYADNPELHSVMLLTMLELWIALDKITIKDIPILADYSPEVPSSLLEHLLLFRTTSSHRLRKAHEYLSYRHSRSRTEWSVFSSTITLDSFSIRFYRNTSHLRRLMSGIRRVPSDEIREIVASLRTITARHAEIDSHDDVGLWGRICEWLSPPNRLLVQVVVFELHCPMSFDMWRTFTLHLLAALCSPPQRDALHVQIDHYRKRQRHFKQSKPHISFATRVWQSCFPCRKAPVPTALELDRVKHGLRLFSLDLWAGILDLHNHGYSTYELPSGPYENLQKYIDSTAHTSNDVIAHQTECHEDLSIHEYMAFGHLRSGGLLQWTNILRELRSRSLNFRRPEVHMLLARAVSQVGPFENMEQVWHQEIQQPSFCHALLQELEILTRDIESNWMEGVTMDTISFLLRRLLASSPNDTVTAEALSLLRIMRGKVFSWIQELTANLLRTSGNEELRNVLRDTAAICRSTFDVDPSVISMVLHSAVDVEILLSSAVIIHDHTPSDVSRLSAYSRLLLDRDCRLSMSLQAFVTDVILTDINNNGIDLAIRSIWPTYSPGSRWRVLPGPNSRWLFCKTMPPAGQHPQDLHFNILDGSLLINGKPFGTWLPEGVMSHPLYKQIFDKQLLEVVASDIQGMDYSTRNLVLNHQVHFSLRNKGWDLVIRAKRREDSTGDSGILELIPRDKLKGDLPTVLLDGYVHWLSLTTSIMEIRPLSNLWESSSDNWMVDCTPGHYRMWKGHDSLVDIRSQSWAMVSSLLRPLAPPEELIISVSPNDLSATSPSLQLSVFLPNYELSFYVDEDGDLLSRDIRGMVYDENQSIGTFFGLINQLVLRPKVKDVNALELISKCVIIPDGKITSQKDGHHTRVEITPQPTFLNRVTYQSYRVNTELGCLTGNGSLTSKLYCAYLHALTSGCGDDPLTGRSGTEEALSVLRSASCCSTMNFSPRDAALLGLIASICPSRTSYSTRHTAQKAAWRALPADSQYHEFCILANVIKERHKMVRLFYDRPSSISTQESPIGEHHVRVPMHSTQRTAHVCPLSALDQSGELNLDDHYHARDLFDKPSLGERRAYIAATCVNNRTATSAKSIWNIVERWTNDVSRDAVLSLRYSKLWLDPVLPSIWLKAYDLLRKSDENKWFQLLFSLPAMAYTSTNLAELVPVFVAFASHPQFCALDPPSRYTSYSIGDGCHPTLHTLRTYIDHYSRPLEQTLPYASHQIYGVGRRKGADEVARMLLDTWPREDLSLGSLDPVLFDVPHLKPEIRRYFSSCSRNLKLKEHLTCVQTILNELHESTASVSIPDISSYTAFSPSRSTPSRIPRRLPALNELFSRPAAQLRTHRGTDGLAKYDIGARGDTSGPDSAASLHRLLATVETDSSSPFQRKYATALRISAESFDSGIFLAEHAMKSPSAETLIEHYTRCRTNYIKALHHIQRSLGPRNKNEETAEQAGLWPRVTAYVLYQCLASNSSNSLSDDWRRCIIRFTLLALELQRARRMVLLHFDDLHEELFRELQNEGCDGWEAEAHPDWLLIQLQGNFSIRRVQAEVANEMISPRSGDNTAMQLNMGEGKSSVIIPIAAAALADGEQLVRVIVPKPLITQTLHLLTDRLCGLTNRRIFYLPFSRSLEIDHQKVVALHQLMLECMRERGILVAQPDHVLSLRLASMDKQLSRRKNDQVAQLLLGLQRWLHYHSRDLLDESDEILDTRSQLVFTIGNMQHVDGSPERWTITQQVLGLVNKHAPSLRNIFPLGVEYEPGPSGSFHHFRILQKYAGEKLISWVIEDIMDGHLPGVSFGQLHSHPGLEDAIRMFISYEDIPSEKAQLIKNSFEETPLWRCLLLLRGLLTAGILLYTFKERRWRVDYGLDATRTMLAVPYRAKDVPAQRAEFSHPDIAIILTCLSYYYIGLAEDQVKLSFEILFEKHVPSLDYELWIQACPDIPESLRTLRGVNIESMRQWDTLYPLFSRNRATINFYLSNVVFPKEAKECPSKLPSSGWDLSEKKTRPVTGFSGTNDGQHLFPLHITQCDLENQGGTNAKVLWYLLQPENNHYACTSHPNGERRTTREFLQLLVAQKPEIRVLLDVGAQMLDLQNHELVQTWLDINSDASAAIYFNEHDELMVCTRDGSTQLLRSSPFAQQIDRCVVYLDDVHTRGTDIRFPTGFRGAITLGPKVTKDRLVQGCMRMRKLGHGHSIMFFAPLGVDLRIRGVAGKDKDPSDVINTTDILHWAIRETWENIRRWAPHWVQQGIEHASRYSAWTDFCADQLHSEELAKKWLLPEAMKLEDFFDLSNPLGHALMSNPNIRQRYDDLGVLSSSLLAVSMDEEGERELTYEVRRERHAQPQVRPAASILPPPANHSIHPAVVDFIRTGVIPKGSNCFGTRSNAFIPAMETLQGTSAASDEPYIWSQSVLVTADFAKTVEASGTTGNYLRPVQWIVSANRGTGHVLVILSPHEANYLLPEIRSSGKVHLHLYTPRTTRSMKLCDDLALYSIPMVPDEWIPPSPQLMDQLNMFAGQLYLKDYVSYIRICRFLGVYAKDLQGEEEIVTQPDGFILPIDRNRFKHSRTEIAHTFATTPLVSLRALMKLRRKGFDYSSTHMGKLLHGRLLAENDFDI